MIEICGFCRRRRRQRRRRRRPRQCARNATVYCDRRRRQRRRPAKAPEQRGESKAEILLWFSFRNTVCSIFGAVRGRRRVGEPCVEYGISATDMSLAHNTRAQSLSGCAHLICACRRGDSSESAHTRCVSEFLCVFFCVPIFRLCTACAWQPNRLKCQSWNCVRVYKCLNLSQFSSNNYTVQYKWTNNIDNNLPRPNVTACAKVMVVVYGAVKRCRRHCVIHCIR